MKNHALIGALLLLLASAGCRGMESENRPIHPNLNMDFQQRYNAQEASDFFANGMAMRAPVPGTVAKGFLREDVRFYSGETESGNYVEDVPVPVTQELLQRGRERYNIFCSVCHGQAGFGQGVVMTGNYGYTPAPSYHKGTLRDTADGYLYEVVTNGVRNMPGYAAQIPVADRWAIVSYIRALQRSQNARAESVPPSVLARIEQTGSANMNAARNPSAGGGGAASSSGGSTGGDSGDASGSGADGGGEDSAPADTASATQTAEAGAAGASGGAAAASSEPSDADTAATTASADTAGGDAAAMDTSSQATAVADDASGASAADDSTAGGEASSADAGGGSFFGSTFFVLLLVVFPIVALTSILVIAFRKDRDH